MKKHILTSAIVSTLILAASGALAADLNPGPQANGEAPGTALTHAAPTVDAAALQRAQSKLAHAMQVARRFEPAAKAQGMGDAWKYALIANLMKSDESSFAAVESAADATDALGRSVASHTANAGGSAKSLGTVTSDLVYVPLSPCRILDTRAGGASAIIGAGQTKTYNYAAVNTGNGGCGVSSAIPGGAFTPAAEAVNVTVDETGLTGFPSGAYIGIFPQGGSLGSAYLAFGPNEIISNAGVISINQSNGQFSILASAPVNVIVDVFGVFIPPQVTALDCVAVGAAGSGLAGRSAVSVPAGSNTYWSTDSCAAGYTVTAPNCYSGGAAGIYLTGSGIVGGGAGLGGSAFCGYNNLSTGAINVFVGASCCRIPGR